VDGILNPAKRRSDIEVRGVFYQAIKNVFPHVAVILPPELGKYFEGEIDPAAWYEGEPYLAALEYLIKHVSVQSTVLLGNELTEMGGGELGEMGVTSAADFAEKLPGIYPLFVRGPGTGGWEAEEFKPGRMVLRETAIISNVDFVTGVLKAVFGVFGAINIRVTVIDERARGADCNRYLVEWLESNDR
jgi:hypothetical protein